jgi:hypothetical protein
LFLFNIHFTNIKIILVSWFVGDACLCLLPR